MTSVAAGSATRLAEPAKKKTRLNPARRKSAKAKSAASSETQPAQDDCNQNVKFAGPRSNVAAAKDDAPHGSRNKASAKSSQPRSHVGAEKKNLKAVCGTDTGSDGGDRGQDGQPRAVTMASPAMVTGGLVGCAAGAAVILGAGLWKNMAGVDSAILTARTAKLCMDNLIEEVITSLKAGTYSAPEAIDMLRRTTLAYASTIPGGASFIERIFREVEMVRKQRGNEVDKVLAEAYTELGKAGQRGATAGEMHALVFKQLAKLSQFASNATQDVLARNPKCRPYMASAAKTLRPAPEKVPTVKVNMAIKHKLPRAATT